MRYTATCVGYSSDVAFEVDGQYPRLNTYTLRLGFYPSHKVTPYAVEQNRNPRVRSLRTHQAD
jgi:hypothetical protein